MIRKVWLAVPRLGVKLVIRSGIVLFGLLALLLVGAMVYLEDPDQQAQDLHDLSAAFEAQPEEARLREFLKAPADASHGLLQLALAGRLLHDHEDVFRELASKRISKSERRILQNIAMLEGAVFEHYPEHEPPGFEAKLAKMPWLKKTF